MPDSKPMSERTVLIDILVKAGIGVCILVVFALYLYTDQKNENEDRAARRSLDAQRLGLIERMVSAMEADARNMARIIDTETAEAGRVERLLEKLIEAVDCGSQSNDVCTSYLGVTRAHVPARGARDGH